MDIKNCRLAHWMSPQAHTYRESLELDLRRHHTSESDCTAMESEREYVEFDFNNVKFLEKLQQAIKRHIDTLNISKDVGQSGPPGYRILHDITKESQDERVEVMDTLECSGDGEASHKTPGLPKKLLLTTESDVTCSRRGKKGAKNAPKKAPEKETTKESQDKRIEVMDTLECSGDGEASHKTPGLPKKTTTGYRRHTDTLNIGKGGRQPLLPGYSLIHDVTCSRRGKKGAKNAPKKAPEKETTKESQDKRIEDIDTLECSGDGEASHKSKPTTVTAENTKALKEKVKSLEEEQERLSNLVLELSGQRKGHTTDSTKTHLRVEREFLDLFDNEGYTAAEHLACKWKTLDKHTLSPQGAKEIVGQVFNESYQACKGAVLEEMFQSVFQPNRRGEQLDTAKDRAGVYGVCLATTPSLSPETEETRLHMQQLLIKKLMRQYGQQYHMSQGSGLNPFEEYLAKAINVAWKMVAIQPPMISTFPTETTFDKTVHDKDGDHWDKKLKDGDYDLVFFQPAVYYSYADKKPKVLAEVGNRQKLKPKPKGRNKT